MNKSKASSEINLLEVLLTLINNKMKIILIIALSIAVGFGFKINRGTYQEVKHSRFTTKFEAVSILEIDNNYKNNKIKIDSKKIQLNRFTLFDVFAEILNGEMAQLVEDFNFIKIEDFQDEKEYIDTLEAITSKIKIYKVKEKNNEDEIYGFIEFDTRYDVVANRWAEFIDTLEYNINKKTKKYLLSIINSQIENARNEKKNQIEDIQNEIRASLEYYDLEMKGRLSFLLEQAKIAREGKVESENVTPSIFGSNYSTNYNGDGLESLYYLKGYLVIEKEIELIKERKNSYLFVKNIPRLEARKLKIESDETLNRMEARFKATPIFNNEKTFSAGKIGRTKTIVQTFKRVTSTLTTIIFSSLIGLIIAIFYIFISRSIHNAAKRNGK
jgi:hypothetical protein